MGAGKGIQLGNSPAPTISKGTLYGSSLALNYWAKKSPVKQNGT